MGLESWRFDRQRHGGVIHYSCVHWAAALDDGCAEANRLQMKENFFITCFFVLPRSLPAGWLLFLLAKRCPHMTLLCNDNTARGKHVQARDLPVR